ncbi:MAG TPA: sensor histidine kinase, partial [Streptomyces sp.]|nr:sensor histidine kinase [Streptomyces sp.]
IGYLHSWQYLRGAWRFAGVTATAAISVTAFFGGPPEPVPSEILSYLLLTAGIVAAVGLFSFIGEITAQRSDERRQMVARLEETLRENAGLHAQLLVQAREAGVMEERQRMAAEIHDTLAQGLTGIIAQLQVVAGTADPVRAREHLDRATALARHSLGEARRSVHNLSPAALADDDLPQALEKTVTEWEERTGVPARYTTTGTVEPLHDEVAATLLRIAQEALANTARHAGATRVGVTLSYMGDTVALDVRDDGRGFDPRVRPARTGTGGFGLDGMRARAERIAGTLGVESEPGLGTAVSARVPLVRHD